PFLMQAATLSYDDYVGRQATGRILEGKVKKGEVITRIEVSGHPSHHKVVRIEGYHGLQKIEMDQAFVGDIVSISGIPEVMIGDTLCSPDKIVQLPPITLQEPTMSIEILVNNGPFAGRDGKHITMNKIRERLMKERKANISLKIEEIRDDAVRVSGRGELHLAVLIEAMRREGYEFLVSKPKVILHEVNGAKEEPMESVHIEVPEGSSGAVIEELSSRKAEMRNLSTNEHGITTIEFLMPTRGLMGYRNTFLTVTKGEGILTSIFDCYGPWKGEIPGRKNGAMISMCAGKATPFACVTLQERGTLFCTGTDDVYEGMVVGIHNRDNDLVVNIAKEKQLNNIRNAAGSEGNIILTPPIKFNLEQALDFIQNDELIEVTPNYIRVRKMYLTENERKRSGSGIKKK
ncbi:MAG: translational GTPase TypA, partial [Anaerolineae bacterium]|nr:translational GTPase TypA [Anaerolineae bacterium]